AIHKGCFPVWKNLRRTSFKRKRRRRCGLRFNPEYFYFRFQGLDCAGDARDQSAAANTSDDGGHIWRVFENFQCHRAMTGNEIIVIERMNECSINSRKASFIERFPSDFVRNWNESRPER